MLLMPGARSKRCRQARPLTWVGKLEERGRPGDGDAHQCRTPVALGAKRSPTQVKGGIARAPGSQKRGPGWRCVSLTAVEKARKGASKRGSKGLTFDDT